jgi:hypothetical protein
MLYETYCANVGGQAFNGDPLPNWNDFRADPSKQTQSDAWVQTAREVQVFFQGELLKSIGTAEPSNRPDPKDPYFETLEATNDQELKHLNRSLKLLNKFDNGPESCPIARARNEATRAVLGAITRHCTPLPSVDGTPAQTSQNGLK